MSDDRIINLLFSAYWEPNRIVDYAEYNDLFDMLRSNGYSAEPAYRFLRENYVMAHDYFPWYSGACFLQDGEMYRRYKIRVRNGEQIAESEQAIFDANSKRLMAFNHFLRKENDNIWARYKMMTGKELDGDDDKESSNSPILKIDSSAMPERAAIINPEEQNKDESKQNFHQNLVIPMQENMTSANKIQLKDSIWSNPKQAEQKSVPNYLSQTITIDGNISVNNGELSISILDNIFHYPTMSDADREAGYYYTPSLDGLTYVRAIGGQNEDFEIHPEDLQIYQDAKGASAKSTIFGGLLPGVASGAAKILPWLKSTNWFYKGSSKAGTLSNLETRQWYLQQEAKIPELINKNASLEEQARQAFDLRNQFRTQARELMADRDLAASLNKTDPNLTWEQVIQKYTEKGFQGDDLYREIVNSAQRSRTSVNKSLGIE